MQPEKNKNTNEGPKSQQRKQECQRKSQALKGGTIIANELMVCKKGIYSDVLKTIY